jgi:hypothetical protein
MQIDFHHAVTYVLARFAGFSAAEAAIIGSSAQFVDDAIDDSPILFDNGARYSRIASAHKALDYRNFEALAASRVWIPFHFLPGNMGQSAGEAPDGPFINRLITIPNSAVAREMLQAACADRASPHGLHRLGISMHVFADTWAHQGFVGTSHIVNHATDLTGPDGGPDKDLADRVKNYFLNNAIPLGHGTVLSNPDKPYLVWAYTNGLGERITRNNPDDYIDAAESMCRAMQGFRLGDMEAEVPGLTATDRNTLQRLLRDIRDEDGQTRHAAWLKELARGTFSFGAETTTYLGEGPGSWTERALGSPSGGTHAYAESFLTSDWKRFHDALQIHRFDVIHRILPRYGICTA